MADTRFLPQASLDALFSALAKDGRRILAPTDRDGRSELNPVTRPSDVAKDYVQTIMSAKETALGAVPTVTVDAL